MKIISAIIIFLILFTSQSQDMKSQTRGTTMGIKQEPYGKTANGQTVHLYTLTNAKGMTVKITNYGGTVTEILLPDKNSRVDNIVLGFDSLQQYFLNQSYFGCIVGRYANRIAKGIFELNDKQYKLAVNNRGNHLHGGLKGFDKIIWQASPVQNHDGVSLILQYISKNGEEGYPGNLSVIVIYTLTNDNALKISYEATTNQATPVNLTHHSYFNLMGAGTSDVLNHEIIIHADKYTVVDGESIPTGELKQVNGSPFDFRTPHKIGERINEIDGGYDHNFVLERKNDSLSLAAQVFEVTSGRIMEVWTTEPGMQFYTGNYLDGSIIGKGGKMYKKHYGFCLETQHFPDSPNHPEFPSTIVHPGEQYHQVTVYKFSIKQ